MKRARAAKVHAQPITNFFAVSALYITFYCALTHLILQGPSKKRKLDHEPSGVTATASTSEVLTTNHVEVSSNINLITIKAATY
jgi:hypothetical protein